MTNLGETVSAARRRSGLSQRSLARRAGTTQTAVSRIERGLQHPSFENFRSLMQGMGWEPTVELTPIAGHREEPRRLLEEARYGDPATRLASGANSSRALRGMRRVERTG